MKNFTLLFITTITLFVITTTLNAQNAVNFDGQDDFIQTASNGILGDTNRTFEAWINVDTAAPSASLTILDYGLNAIGSRNTFLVNGNRGLSFISGGTNANISSTQNVITPGQWTHVAFVLNNGVGFLYVNGIEVGTGSLTTVNTPNGNANITIGQRVNGGNVPFYGSIDEVRIWNVARDTAQIRANMNSEFCNLPVTLSAYYPLNEGIAGGNNAATTITFDQVANNNGTLIGFALLGDTSNWVLGAPSIINGKSFDTLNVTSCKPINSPSGNYIYSLSGTYLDTIPNTVNCDSIITIIYNLINNTSYTNLTISSCDDYTSPSGNSIYTTSGSYLDTISTFQNCDSIFAINLTITRINNSVTTTSGNTLNASETGARYQWLDCNNGFSKITNDTNRIFNPTINGSYAVEITKNGCVDTSACIPVIGVGLADVNFKDLISVSNNPTKGLFWLNNNTNQIVNSSLYDLNGKLVILPQNSGNKGQKFNLTDFPEGIYILNVRGEKGEMVNFKIIKN